MRPTRSGAVLAFALATLVATGCGGGSQTDVSAAGTGKTVTISNFEFAPDTLQVKVGDTVTVDNKDSAEHSLTAKDMSFDTGRFASGTRTFRVTKPGRFDYICIVHPFMTGKVIQVTG